MIETKVFYDRQATETIRFGVNKAADAVKVTLGGRGRIVYYNHAQHTANGIQFYKPKGTKDGVTVLKNFELTDQIENFGVELIKEISQKTADEVGDATTSTAILLQALMNMGLDLIEDGCNPMEVKKGMDAAIDYVVSQVKLMARHIGTDSEAIKQVATVSANNDETIGQLIADAYKKIGSHGLLKIEKSGTSKTEVKITKGFEIKQGYIHQWFVTNDGKGECDMVNPYILFYDKEILHMQELLPILEQVVAAKRPLLIFCEDLDGDALATLATNVKNKTIRACAVKSPFFGNRKIDAMNDMALLTGAKFINASEGIRLENVLLDMCGTCESVNVSINKTVIAGANGDKDKINEYIKGLAEKLEAATDADEKAYLETRVAKLRGGMAIFHVGAMSDSELSEKLDRCDDAVRATKAAIEEGTVVGGGCSFLKIKEPVIIGNNSYKKGHHMVFEAIKSPFKQILANAGINAENKKWWNFGGSESILNQVASANQSVGFNVLTEKVDDLLADGIIDPVKAVRCSLQNAASIAGTIFITGCVFARNVKQ